MEMIPVLTISCFFFCFFGDASSKYLKKPLIPQCCHNRIVGGADTDISEIPYQAALLWRDYYFCGGAIINERFIVTGAHCILFVFQMFDSENELMIRVGSNYSGKGGILVRPENTTCHPKFDFDSYDYDVCLIKLETPLKFNKNIQPVKIGTAEPKEGQIGRVAGWGTLWEGGRIPEKLQSVMVPVTNQTFCKEAYEKISPVTDRMFCAGEEGKDSCQGDSGGGLVVNGTLLGVISTGYGCGMKNFPGVYTNIVHPEIKRFIVKTSKI